MKKSFALGKGNYYFTIRQGGPSGILVKRTSKEDAVYSYQSYVKAGKQCEWHGCWDGKKFQEASSPPKN